MPTRKMRAKDAERMAFDTWLAKYYVAKQHPLTVEALWEAWKQGHAWASSPPETIVKGMR